MDAFWSREGWGFAAFGLSYLLGSVPFGVLLTRAAGIGDLRRIGSGNIGATNVLRTGRRGLALATLLLDGAKGVVAVGLVARLLGAAFAPVAAWAAVCGHCFPVWLGFRGGKGVATGLGVLLALDWRIGLVSCAVWLVMVAATRISSAGALAAFAVAPITAGLLHPGLCTAATLGVTLIVFARHAENMRRLLRGLEPRIGAGR